MIHRIIEVCRQSNKNSKLRTVQWLKCWERERERATEWEGDKISILSYHMNLRWKSKRLINNAWTCKSIRGHEMKKMTRIYLLQNRSYLMVYDVLIHIWNEIFCEIIDALIILIIQFMWWKKRNKNMLTNKRLSIQLQKCSNTKHEECSFKVYILIILTKL